MGNEGKSEHAVQSTFPAIIRPELLTGRHLELEGPCPAAVATTEVDPSSWVHGRTDGRHCSVVFKSACTYLLLYYLVLSLCLAVLIFESLAKSEQLCVEVRP